MLEGDGNIGYWIAAAEGRRVHFYVALVPAVGTLDGIEIPEPSGAVMTVWKYRAQITVLFIVDDAHTQDRELQLSIEPDSNEGIAKATGLELLHIALETGEIVHTSSTAISITTNVPSSSALPATQMINKLHPLIFKIFQIEYPQPC